MLFKRNMLTDQAGLPQPGRAGAGMAANFAIIEKLTAANHTLTIAEMAGGLVYYSALAAGISVTTPTAVQILAACPDMDIGDSFTFLVSIQDAFAITWVAGVGITLTGKATTPASGQSFIVVTKLSATTASWFVA